MLLLASSTLVSKVKTKSYILGPPMSSDFLSNAFSRSNALDPVACMRPTRHNAADADDDGDGEGGFSLQIGVEGNRRDVGRRPFQVSEEAGRPSASSGAD